MSAAAEVATGEGEPAGLGWREVAVPPLPNVPAMTSAAEQQFYYWTTRERYRELGAVVELGCWLGAGTVHLAAGLRDRGLTTRVHALDRFVWSANSFDAKFAAGLPTGGDFEPLFRANTAELAPWIEPIRAELDNFEWRGGPIEILMVDAPKHAPIIVRCLDIFGPHLIPGKSLIAFQDYLHSVSYALPAILSLFGESLELVDAVVPGSTGVFEVRAPLVIDAARREACRLEGWSVEEMRERFRRVLDGLPDAARPRLALSLPMMLHDHGHRAEALAELELVRDLPVVRRRMQAWAKGLFYPRYYALFDALDIHPEVTPVAELVKVASRERRSGNLPSAMSAVRRALAADPGSAQAAAELARIERRPRMPVKPVPATTRSTTRRLKRWLKQSLRRLRGAHGPDRPG